MLKRSLTTRKKLLVSLILASGLGLVGYLLTMRKPTKAKAIKRPFDFLDNTPYNLMRPLIVAQSKVESGNYSSDLFKRSNNAFGMKNASRRDQLGSPEAGTDYRKYSSLSESIQDFVLYLNAVKFPTVFDVSSYVRELKKRGYFESSQSDYIKAMESWM